MTAMRMWLLSSMVAGVMLLCCALPGAAEAAVPIEGMLLVMGWDAADIPYSYSMQVTSDTVVPTPWAVDLPDVSPGATQVAYDVRTASDTYHAQTGDIWVANIDGSSAINLTGPAGLGGVNCRPAWSPDGLTLAFQHAAPAVGQRTCDAGWQVWLVGVDGSQLHQWLSAPTGPTLTPIWAPDGYHLMCEGPNQTWLAGDITGGPTVVVAGVNGRDVEWSRDGARIAYAAMVPDTVSGELGVWEQLCVANPDGSNMQVLVQQFLKDSDVNAHIAKYQFQPPDDDWLGQIRWIVGPRKPKWSPVGDRIAFLADLPFDPNGADFRYQREVWLYDLNIGQLARLTNDDKFDDSINWAGPNTLPSSPDVTVANTNVAFSQVAKDGWTSIVRQDSPPALPASYQKVGTFYKVHTTALVTGPAEVSMAYDAATVPGTAEGHLKLLRYNEGSAQWQDITVSRDFTNHTIHGETTVLGLMGLAWPLPESDFPDVSDSETDPFWALWEIEAAFTAGIVQGYPNGNYGPADAVSRAQMAVYISRALAGGEANVPPTPTAVSFPDDVSADHWAYKYVEYAVEAGVVQGYDATHYRPDTIVTRDQMTVFVARAKQWVHLGEDMATAPELFTDVPAGFWCGTAVQACVEHGVVQGYPGGTYHPEREVTRDQMAVYVARAFELPR